MTGRPSSDKEKCPAGRRGLGRGDGLCGGSVLDQRMFRRHVSSRWPKLSLLAGNTPAAYRHLRDSGVLCDRGLPGYQRIPTASPALGCAWCSASASPATARLVADCTGRFGNGHGHGHRPFRVPIRERGHASGDARHPGDALGLLAHRGDPSGHRAWPLPRLGDRAALPAGRSQARRATDRSYGSVIRLPGARALGM